MDLHEVTARLEIQQQLANYANGVDWHDWDLYRSVFTDDGHIDYTDSIPLEGTPLYVSAFLEVGFSRIEWSQHYITNVSYAFDGDACAVKAFFYNPCQLPGIDGVTHHYGFYDHRFVNTPEGWKSAHLVETMKRKINGHQPDLDQFELLRATIDQRFA